MRNTLLPLVAALSACSGTSFSGTVADVTGAPLTATTVTVVGTQCQSVVDDAGAFSFGCQPGEHRVAIARSGYISKEIEVDATEPNNYDLGKTVLIRIPSGEGLFMFNGSEYAPMERSTLQRTLVGSDQKAFCLNAETAKPNAQKAGRVPLFDKEYSEWRAWKLDADGCAYKSTRDGSKWEETYAERPSHVEQRLEPGKTVYLVDMPAGDYFIADWRNGWFVEDKDPDRAKADKHYAGFLIRTK